MFVKAAEYLGERPEDCLVVEDAEAGIDAGIAGGMKTAAIGDAVNCGKADYTLQQRFRICLKYLYRRGKNNGTVFRTDFWILYGMESG